MGIGKTEAALALAEILANKLELGGIYFGLPTQATANGIFTRINEWAQKQSDTELHSIRLAHAAAELNDDYQQLKGVAQTNEEEADYKGAMIHQWFSGRKQALLANFVIGTVDQLLMAGLRKKHVMLRHLGLAGKVVIVDECHAYDAYMNEYLKTILTWLGAYHVPVILLSATLPSRTRTALIAAYMNSAGENVEKSLSSKSDYPLITWTDGEKVHQQIIPFDDTPKQIDIVLSQCGYDDGIALAKEIAEQMTDGGCIGVIVNTVKRAQCFAKICKQYIPDAEIKVVHSQFIMMDRVENEAQLVASLGKHAQIGNGRPDKMIVVGTQVLEQSLDIDFDALWTDLCPMDLLLQRIGRMHRHQRKRPSSFEQPICHVLCACEERFEEGAKAIYGEYLLMKTRKMLQQRNSILLPSDIPLLVQTVYDEENDLCRTQDGYMEALNQYRKEINKKENNAQVFCIHDPYDDDEAQCLYRLMKDEIIDKNDATAAEAAVRDGDFSIEVICLKKMQNGKFYSLNDKDEEFGYSGEYTPTEAEARHLLKQRLRLPHSICQKYMIDKTVRYLEVETNRQMKEWRYSHWLCGELFLIFNDENQTSINECSLSYSNEYGLEIERKDGDYARK